MTLLPPPSAAEAASGSRVAGAAAAFRAAGAACGVRGVATPTLCVASLRRFVALRLVNLAPTWADAHMPAVRAALVEDVAAAAALPVDAVAFRSLQRDEGTPSAPLIAILAIEAGSDDEAAAAIATIQAAAVSGGFPLLALEAQVAAAGAPAAARLDIRSPLRVSDATAAYAPAPESTVDAPAAAATTSGAHGTALGSAAAALTLAALLAHVLRA
jgi:hypothetical protein